MTQLENIASQLLKAANEADRNYIKTRDQSQKDEATRLRVIVENLKNITLGASDLSGLSDVTITTPANLEALVYNGITSQWTNQQIVNRIIAGANITVSPVNGRGEVTISSTGGGGVGTTSNVLIDGGSFVLTENVLVDAGSFV